MFRQFVDEYKRLGDVIFDREDYQAQASLVIRDQAQGILDEIGTRGVPARLEREQGFFQRIIFGDLTPEEIEAELDRLNKFTERTFLRDTGRPFQGPTDIPFVDLAIHGIELAVGSGQTSLDKFYENVENTSEAVALRIGEDADYWSKQTEEASGDASKVVADNAVRVAVALGIPVASAQDLIVTFLSLEQREALLAKVVDVLNEAFFNTTKLSREAYIQGVEFTRQIESGIPPLQASANVLYDNGEGLREMSDGLLAAGNSAEYTEDQLAALARLQIEVRDRIHETVAALGMLQDAWRDTLDLPTSELRGAFGDLQRYVGDLDSQRRDAYLRFLRGEVGEGFFGTINRAYERAAAELERVNARFEESTTRPPSGKTQAELLIDQWREAERVAKQYFDNVRDQLDDQQRALTRASEDVVDLINRQFTERFLALAETANITADERRRIEVRLRAQRDLTLAEARRENREEQRRVEDRLEVEEDRRRRQEQEASNAIARLRGANVPTGRRGDPIHVVQDDSGATQASTGATTGTDGSTGTTTTTGTQTGADGVPPSAMPTPANQCNGDPNFATFNTAAAQMRGAGLTPPPPRCDQLPLQIRGMWTAIRHRRAQDAAAAARLAAVQGTQGAPQVGDPDIGPPDPTPTPPNNDGIPEPGDAGFGGTGRTRTMTDDREIGEGRAATDAVKENTKAIKELAERINTGGFEGFGGGPTAGTRRSSTGHGQQYYVDPARGRL